MTPEEHIAHLEGQMTMLTLILVHLIRSPGGPQVSLVRKEVRKIAVPGDDSRSEGMKEAKQRFLDLLAGPLPFTST